MVAQLPPSPHFKKLFKSAYAAGQGKKSICSFGHHVFALMHGVNQIEFVTVVTRQFFFSQRSGNNSYNFSTGLLRSRSNHTHQTTVSTAVDQLTLALTYPLANSLCGLFVGGQFARA